MTECGGGGLDYHASQDNRFFVFGENCVREVAFFPGWLPDLPERRLNHSSSQSKYGIAE